MKDDELKTVEHLLGKSPDKNIDRKKNGETSHE